MSLSMHNLIISTSTFFFYNLVRKTGKKGKDLVRKTVNRIGHFQTDVSFCLSYLKNTENGVVLIHLSLVLSV